MSYQIDYGKNTEMKRENTASQRGWMTAGCCALFLMWVMMFWDAGREVLRDALIPGKPEVTMAAVDCFARELGDGRSFETALKAFCQRIMFGGH